MEFMQPEQSDSDGALLFAPHLLLSRMLVCLLSCQFRVSVYRMMLNNAISSNSYQSRI